MSLIIEAKLDELAKLEEDWDSYGAHPLPPRTIYLAKKFAKIWEEFRLVPMQPAPGADGTISFEWHNGKKSLIIGIGDKGINDIFVADDDDFFMESSWPDPSTSGGYIPE